MIALLTLSLVGLFVGFVFSMPIAGPVSILVTTHALNGHLRFCILAAIGASVADFIYVFASVFGLTRFYSFLKPAIPYVLLGGMFFLFYIGYRISNTRLDLGKISQEGEEMEKSQSRRGFVTGFLLNFLNPTLFFSWLTSSFIVISIVSSLGFSTGGLSNSVDNSFNSINKKGEDSALKEKTLSYLHIGKTGELRKQPAEKTASWGLSLVSSILYAFFLSLGGVLWFVYLSYLLTRNRHRINIGTINTLIRWLGYSLYFFGAFLGYHALTLWRS